MEKVMPPTTKSNKRDEQKEGTRVKLLEATVDCLNNLGFHRITTPEVCRRAGVAQGTFFYHFGSKQELIGAVHAYIHNQLLFQTEDFYLNLLTEAPAERICKLLDYIWENDFSGKYAIAVNEIHMAARSDEELHQRILPDDEANFQKISERWAKYFYSLQPDMSIEMLKDMIYIFIAGIAPIIGHRDSNYQNTVFESWKRMIVPMIGVKDQPETV
jgi:AcrR family transcriptional regulator